MTRSQISAYISAETRERLERYAEAHGLKKGSLVEAALLHHLQALDELPADVIIPPRLVVSAESMRKIVDMIENPPQPTEAMRQLFATNGD